MGMRRGNWGHVVLRHLATAVLIVCAAVACGKKGPPKPPEEVAPAPVQFFTILPEESSVILSWQAPDTDANGDELTDLATFLVRRRVVTRDTTTEFETVAEVPVSRGDPTTGRFQYRDTELVRGARYEYAVVPVNEEGNEGRASSVLRFTFVGESSLVETIS